MTRTSPLIFLAILLACRDGDPAPVVIETDSAGTVIATPSAVPRLDDAGSMWSLRLTRVVPSADDDLTVEPMLYNPQSALRMRDGTLVVLDGAEHRLVVIDGTENLVRGRFGKVGGGPGEMSSIQIAPMWETSSGSFRIYDGIRGRISRYAPDGALLEEVHLGSTGGPLVVWAAAAARTGELWVLQFFPSDDFQGTGEATDSLGLIDMATGTVDYRIRTPPRVPSPPVHPRPLWHPRIIWTVLDGGRIVAARNDVGDFHVFGPDGHPERLIRTGLVPRPATDEARARAMEFFGRGNIPGVPATITFNSTLQLFVNMTAVDDTTFAIHHLSEHTAMSDNPLSEGVAAWRLLSISGRPLGSVVFPAGFEPWKVSAGRILGVAHDSLDVAEIREYELVPPGPS